MEDFIRYLIKESVGVENIEIEKRESGSATVFDVKVPQESIALVIGKNGRTIKSIRNLLKVKATIEKTKVDINLLQA